MSNDEFVAIIKTLSSVTWDWEKAAWLDIAASLHIHGDIAGQAGSFSLLDRHELGIGVSGNKVVRMDVLLESTKDLYHLPEHEYDQEDERLTRSFHQYVDWASAVLGPPEYKGAINDEDFPDDLSGSWLAYWLRSNAVMQVVLTHNDDNGPIELDLFIDPPN